jgi:hypothetical protein
MAYYDRHGNSWEHCLARVVGLSPVPRCGAGHCRGGRWLLRESCRPQVSAAEVDREHPREHAS